MSSGFSSTPFLLNATIQHHMNGYKEVDQQFVEKLKRSIYVDDVTFGACNEHETFQLYKKIKCWLAEGAFNLRKFRTNCPELQKWIDMQECQGADLVPSDQKNTTADDESYVRNTLGDCHVNSSGEKVLGVQWDCTSDQLSFNIHHIYKAAKWVEPTKWSIIGVVSRFYDSLGVLSPFTVLFKMLFQKLCINMDAPTLFTGSKIVLFWIQGHDKEWRQFVVNRVREICQLTSVKSWRHCPGKDNPADLPSRGADLDTLTNDPLWLNEPTWLGDILWKVTRLLRKGHSRSSCLNLRSKHQSQFWEAFSLLVTSGLETLICFGSTGEMNTLLG